MMDCVMNLVRVKWRDHQRITRGPLAEYSIQEFDDFTPRAGNDSGGGQLGNCIHCKPGGINDYLYIVVQEHVWEALATRVGGEELVNDPRFADNAARVANRPALEAAMGAVFGALSCDEAIRRLEAAQIAWGRVNDVAGLSAHPELRRVPVETPNGPAQMVPPGASVRELGPPRLGAVPALDEHGPATRAEFAADRTGG